MFHFRLYIFQMDMNNKSQEQLTTYVDTQFKVIQPRFKMIQPKWCRPQKLDQPMDKRGKNDQISTEHLWRNSILLKRRKLSLLLGRSSHSYPCHSSELLFHFISSQTNFFQQVKELWTTICWNNEKVAFFSQTNILTN